MTMCMIAMFLSKIGEKIFTKTDCKRKSVEMRNESLLLFCSRKSKVSANVRFAATNICSCNC